MSAPALKYLQIKDANGVTVVDFVGSELMFESSLIQEIGDELHSLLVDHDRKQILLDFRQCPVCFEFHARPARPAGPGR